MNSIEYLKTIERSESPNFDIINKKILHGVIGCSTEVGELVDIVKKSLFHNQPIAKWALIEEIGDIFWYLGLICNEIDCTFEEIMEMNIKKLKERYPDQYTDKDNQNRDYQAEQVAAEQGE